MTTSDFRFGFRIVGATCEPRRLVDAGAAFVAHCAADPRCEPDKECYLSAFQFGEDFRRLLTETGSTAGFAGACWSPWLWFDIDAEGDLARAQAEAEAIAETIMARYGIRAAGLLIFFSGSKGFHVGLPTALWLPPPSADFHRTARRFAESLADVAAVVIDAGVYDRVRAFRAPNSRHPKTGLHKRRLSLDELRGPLDAILELAKTPAGSPIPNPQSPIPNPLAAADWKAAAALVTSEGEAKAARRAAGNGSPTLNKATLIFIREGATPGDRHRLLFSAAANLGEFGCSLALAAALLEESALDSGLPPKDVRRQIECGLVAAGSASSAEPTHQDCAGLTRTASDGSTIEKPPERITCDSAAFQGQTCQQVTRATGRAGAEAPGADLQAALANLWHSPPAPKIDQGEAVPAVLTPLPPPLVPLPPGAVGSGTLDKPCRCGSTEYVELPISEGRTRRDCRKCGCFVGFGKWYDQGGPAR